MTILSMNALLLYASELRKIYATGNATEHTYRPALNTLLNSLDPDLRALNEPQRSEAGMPDYLLARGVIPVGYIEAKDLDKDLDKLDSRELAQQVRYQSAYGNLIYTNYLEFRWYEFDQEIDRLSIGELKRGKLTIDETQLGALDSLLRRFAEKTAPEIQSVEALARRMAAMTREIARLIVFELKLETPPPGLKGLWVSFQDKLILNLELDAFADMYAQTIAYGLFAARMRYQKKPDMFTVESAFRSLPPTNPLLKQLFTNIAANLGERVSSVADGLARVLAYAKVDEIMAGFGRSTQRRDPVFHFYETFLSVYDQTTREKRGVYYTPEPVVSFIVRAVDHVLRTDFGKPDGLADASTYILDPAVGTGTFLHEVIDLIHDHMEGRGQLGAWDRYVNDKLLGRIFGFELLMASYTIAHMKLGLQLEQYGYTFNSERRLGLYLTNTLESPDAVKVAGGGMDYFLADESQHAAAVKKEKQIMVVLGNPPYSGHSANRSYEEVEVIRQTPGKLTKTGVTAVARKSIIRQKNFIGTLLDDYYQVDGKPLGERNPKWLQDDYVKFIRFGQWRIDQTGYGVLAYVTNHGYIDNPTFRGMRQQLMKAFTDIYILNLHGNSKKKERTPEGGADENVFDIQQGVAIGVFVKNTLNPPADGSAQVHYADLWGKRAEKYAALGQLSLDSVSWETFTPQAPFYLFSPQNLDLKGEYDRGWRIADIMPKTLLGSNSHRDDFAIAFDKNTAQSRINDLANTLLDDVWIREKYGLKDNRDWKLNNARSKVTSVTQPFQCLYRPFDTRFMLYGDYAFDYPRQEINDHLLYPNFALISTKQTKEDFSVFATNNPVGQHKLATPYDGSYVSPLYLYPDPKNPQLTNISDWQTEKDGRIPNLSRVFVKAFAEKLGLAFLSDGKGDLTTTFAPEDIFHYAYAVFHSRDYRSRYAEFLKIDFPRLPLTSDKALFAQLCGIGEKLVNYHLMRGAEGWKLITRYDVKGTHQVEAKHPSYKPQNTTDGLMPETTNGRVYINKTQYFDGVQQSVWEFKVGGYQVLEKWLKDRRGRTLTGDEIEHYQQIVVALTETIRLMDVIDKTVTFPMA